MSDLPAPPLDRAGVEAFLATIGANAITHDHSPIFTVEEGRAYEHLTPGAHSKNLFLKDAKDQLWLISAWANSAIDLKALPPVIGSARLSFGSPALMQDALGVTQGSVTALALLNDPTHRVRFVIDQALLDADHVNFHPLRNDATTCLPQQGLQRYLYALRRPIWVVDFEQMHASPLDMTTIS